MLTAQTDRQLLIPLSPLSPLLDLRGRRPVGPPGPSIPRPCILLPSQVSSLLNEIGPSHARKDAKTVGRGAERRGIGTASISQNLSIPRITRRSSRIHAERRRKEGRRRSPRDDGPPAPLPSMDDADEDDAADLAYKVVNAPLSLSLSFPPSLRPSSNR